jgi:hypothetical protein
MNQQHGHPQQDDPDIQFDPFDYGDEDVVPSLLDWDEGSDQI